MGKHTGRHNAKNPSAPIATPLKSSKPSSGSWRIRGGGQDRSS